MSQTLLKLYAARDLMASKALVNEGLACKPGCNACCSHAVAITLEDALILSERIFPDEVDRLSDIWAEQCSQFEEVGWRRYRSPCAILDSEGKCSMYPHRPWPCRIYNSRDASACERGETVQSVRPPWDRMFARLVQIATTQDFGLPLTETTITEANRYWLMPAALLHMRCNHWDGQIPDVYEYTPGPSQDKWERSLCKS